MEHESLSNVPSVPDPLLPLRFFDRCAANVSEPRSASYVPRLATHPRFFPLSLSGQMYRGKFRVIGHGWPEYEGIRRRDDIWSSRRVKNRGPFITRVARISFGRATTTPSFDTTRYVCERGGGGGDRRARATNTSNTSGTDNSSRVYWEEMGAEYHSPVNSPRTYVSTIISV